MRLGAHVTKHHSDLSRQKMSSGVPTGCFNGFKIAIEEGHFVGIPPEEPLEQQSYRSTRRRTGFWKRTGAIATSFITVTGMMLDAAVTANAAPVDNSEALGQLLEGEARGSSLGDLAGVNGPLAENASVENPVVRNPLGAEVLNVPSVDVDDRD